MAKHGNYKRNAYEPSALRIKIETAKIRKGLTTSQLRARRGDTLDRNGQALGWHPPVVRISDVEGHPSLLAEVKENS